MVEADVSKPGIVKLTGEMKQFLLNLCWSLKQYLRPKVLMLDKQSQQELHGGGQLAGCSSPSVPVNNVKAYEEEIEEV